MEYGLVWDSPCLKPFETGIIETKLPFHSLPSAGTLHSPMGVSNATYLRCGL